MAMTNTHVIVQENGILIPKELFGRNELVLAELKDAGVLVEPTNGKHAPANGKPPVIRCAPLLDHSRQLRWLEEHRHQYLGQWVALDGDQLLSHGPNAFDVAQAARAAGVASPYLARVQPPEEVPFGGW